MSDSVGLKRVRVTLDMARREINRGNIELALQSLRQIKDEMDPLVGTIEWIEFSLTTGEAFLALRSAAAGSHLLDAGERMDKLSDCPPDLEMRVYERLGDFYATVVPKQLGLAREYLAHAKRAALELRVEDLTARIDLKILALDIKIDRHPEGENFRTLRRVGKADGYTEAEQLIAWSFHAGNSGESRNGLRFARGISSASEEYFRDLLRSVRMK
jgi:hypothetical protein